MNFLNYKQLWKWSLMTVFIAMQGTAMATPQQAIEIMSKDGHGVFVHFVERDVANVPWNDRIQNFDVVALADVAEAGGASFLMFTLTHWDLNLPFPLPANASTNLQNIFSEPDRTATRDLMSDLYNELNSRGIKLYFYFNAFADGESEAFKAAWGYPDGDWLNNVYELVELISLEYGTKVSGWWLENMSLTAKPGSSDIDRILLAQKLRAGNPDAVIAYNVGGQQAGQIPFANDAAIAGIVDYTGGHLKNKNLNYLKPVSKFDSNGILNHRVEHIDNIGWWIDALPEDVPSYFHHPRYAMDNLLEYMKDTRSVGAVMNWNMAPYIDGSIDPRSAAQMEVIGQVMRKGKEYVSNTASNIVYVNFDGDISQTWNSDRTIAYSTTIGATATFSFNGSQVEIWAKKSSTAGNCEVLIDGVSHGTHSQYSSSDIFQQKVFDSGMMASGSHTVQLKNSVGGTGCHLDHILYTPELPTKVDGAQFTYDSNWNSRTRSASYNDTIHYTRSTDASATYTFTGDKFQIFSQVGPDGGKFDVSINNEVVATVDTYTPSYVHQQLVFASEILVPGEHEIKITARADTNPASNNKYVHLDYIQVNETLPNGYVIDANHHDIDYDAGWKYQENDEAYSNTVYYSNTTNTTATYTFNGSGVTVYSRKGKNHGDCRIEIDGNVADTVDTYHPSHQHKVKIFEDLSLSTGNHTIEIYPTGTHNASSGGYYCVLDRIEVTP
ncbi:hypothetical protein [uncultured Paraglaciecola sp.]|uniref:hypothetical protein n=1 Tax=uncultured Paraglaciecola sp. TaxID=1765024 RepID=UPI0030DB4723|tara:strand:+ start:138388 stop:140556 length:2169 start_codon:yes stop_codon:yes gene_type:complete